MSVKIRNLKIAFFICLCSFSFLTVSIEAQSLPGDANKDGTVNIMDALLVARYNSGYAVAIDISQVDVNCDGMVNINDALRLAQYCSGLISNLMCTVPTPNPMYVPGEVIVGFNDYVTLEQADNLINSFNLSWEQHFPITFAIWLEVEGEPEQYIALLTASPIVAWAQVRGYSGGDPDKSYIIAQINGKGSKEEAENLINGIAGLKIVQYVTSPKWGLVKVPVGTETKWINTFTSQSIIKYAELNHIVTID